MLSTFANAAPVVEVTAALSQPAIAAGSSLANSFAETAPAFDEPAVKSAASARSQPAEKPASALPDWSMLLVGAGVLLLPRRRRIDNSVR